MKSSVQRSLPLPFWTGKGAYFLISNQGRNTCSNAVILLPICNCKLYYLYLQTILDSPRSNISFCHSTHLSLFFFEAIWFWCVIKLFQTEQCVKLIQNVVDFNGRISMHFWVISCVILLLVVVEVNHLSSYAQKFK